MTLDARRAAAIAALILTSGLAAPAAAPAAPRWQAAELVAPLGEQIASPAAAAGADGSAAITWWRYTGAGEQRELRVAFRAPDGRFSAPRTVSAACTFIVGARALQPLPGGRYLIAFTNECSDGTVTALVGDARGLGPAQALGHMGRDTSDRDIATASDGGQRSAVAFSAQGRLTAAVLQDGRPAASLALNDPAADGRCSTPSVAPAAGGFVVVAQCQDPPAPAPAASSPGAPPPPPRPSSPGGGRIAAWQLDAEGHVTTTTTVSRLEPRIARAAPQVLTSAAGQTTATWTDLTSDFEAATVLRRADLGATGWTPPAEVDRIGQEGGMGTGVTPLSLSLSARGDQLAAYQSGSRIFAASALPGGPFAARQLATSSRPPAAPVTALSAAGVGTVVWAGEPGLMAAVRNADGTFSGPAQITPDGVSADQAAAAVAADGDVLVLFRGRAAVTAAAARSGARLQAVARERSFAFTARQARQGRRRVVALRADRASRVTLSVDGRALGRPVAVRPGRVVRVPVRRLAPHAALVAEARAGQLRARVAVR